MKFSIMCLILSFSAHAHVIHGGPQPPRDPKSFRIEKYNLNEFCITVTNNKNSEMKILNKREVECSGKKFSTIDFCFKKNPKALAMSDAYIDLIASKIICDIDMSPTDPIPAAILKEAKEKNKCISYETRRCDPNFLPCDYAIVCPPKK